MDNRLRWIAILALVLVVIVVIYLTFFSVRQAPTSPDGAVTVPPEPTTETPATR